MQPAVSTLQATFWGAPNLKILRPKTAHSEMKNRQAARPEPSGYPHAQPAD